MDYQHRLFIGILMLCLWMWMPASAGEYPNSVPKILASPMLSESPAFGVSGEDEDFLESLFAPEAIPPAGIPILENGLGDLVHDSVVNILDLLRLRDIIIGRPPAASQFEAEEGDLKDGITVKSHAIRAEPPTYDISDSTLSWAMRNVEMSTEDNISLWYTVPEQQNALFNTMVKLSNDIVKRVYDELLGYVEQKDEE